MTRLSADSVSDASGKQYHIGCKVGDLADFILLVGDPSRVDRAREFFDSIRFETKHREYVTLTGTCKGLEISVMATGIGQDNTEIAVIEICQIVKNPTFIRCGSSSSLQPNAKIGELAVSKEALRMENTTSFYVPDEFEAVAHSDIVNALTTACKKLKKPFHVGMTASASGFYGAQGREAPGFPIRFPNLVEDLQKKGVLNFEMETSTLFVLSSIRGVRAGAICALFGNRATNEFADEKERLASERSCLEVSFAAFQELR